MISLRDKLKSYGTKQERPKAPPAQADCYRVSGRTKRGDYGLPDFLNADLIKDLSGMELSADVPLESLLFLDTETTGLSGGAGTIAFLTGLGWFEGNEFVVEQDLMRDYPEEGAMLDRVQELVERSQMLVTFNGRTFDLPLLESRYTMNGRRVALTRRQHLDLLHPARAVFKLRLRHCRLSNLEEAVLGIAREDDMPGSEIPKAWFDYLKTGDFTLIEQILDHNAQDIRSMPLILGRLMEMYRAPLSEPYQEDIYSIGRVLDRRGQTERARKCYHAADKGAMSLLSRLSLAESYRKGTDYQASAQVYERMLKEGQGSVEVLVRLAILYEHRLGRPEEALRLTQRAMLLCEDDEQAEQLNRRYRRLKSKTERTV
ncbi:MAG: ribonuclease H-like domain-containing protein [Clostridia bacterium]|nr:ribonuclease H-like domain-containing protein [Clostridia bacterium]